MVFGKKRKAKKEAEFNKKKENLKKAVSDYNKLSEAEKKKRRRWGTS